VKSEIFRHLSQMRDFQSGFEYLSRSKTFLHSLGQKRSPTI